MTLALLALVVAIASICASTWHLYWVLRLGRALAEGRRIAAENQAADSAKSLRKAERAEKQNNDYTVALSPSARAHIANTQRQAEFEPSFAVSAPSEAVQAAQRLIDRQYVPLPELK
ncbi:hypothetical protein ACFO5K_04400 [Nocardia halotolerans]|uniref:Uncharacterized protein n=1 Tax=Nocardia halotolerans TaxID=1755878 RepID=A0ABV8VBR6_9NOCA